MAEDVQKPKKDKQPKPDKVKDPNKKKLPGEKKKKKKKKAFKARPEPVQLRHPLEAVAGSADAAWLKRRHRKEAFFRNCSRGAVAFSLIFMAVLLLSVMASGWSAFLQTKIRLNVSYDSTLIHAELATATPETVESVLKRGNYGAVVKAALAARFVTVPAEEQGILNTLLSRQAVQVVRQAILKNPDLLGRTETLWLTASTDVDMFMKGKISREDDESMRRLKNNQIALVDDLKSKGEIRRTFNTGLFTNGDSREPEQAGVLGSIIGSFYTIGICILITFPLGVGAAVYLEEFAPKNRLADIIEVNINNLAAVPSIIFGLLGLAVYLNFFGMPRSSPLVGGLTLAFLIMPTLVIASRNALKSVPDSIRQAATGLGASPMQVVFHHVIPLALPGILTGTILGVARALGETAPLLMIGMVAFVADVPSHMTDAATTLPVQVFLWSDSPELAFAEKTAAAIMVLIFFMILMNALAVYLRRRLEVRW